MNPFALVYVDPGGAGGAGPDEEAHRRRLSGREVGEECLVAVEFFESGSAACARRYSLSVVQ